MLAHPAIAWPTFRGGLYAAEKGFDGLNACNLPKQTITQAAVRIYLLNLSQFSPIKESLHPVGRLQIKGSPCHRQVVGNLAWSQTGLTHINIKQVTKLGGEPPLILASQGM
jgi:hypothetical protein